jgi:hypothetical protein
MLVRRRILVVGTLDAVQTARAILGDGFEYRCAFSLDEARAELHPGVALVLCHMRFDGDRMVDFLEVLRDDEHCGRLPVVCFHAHSSNIGSGAYEAMQAVLKGFDEAKVVDLHSIARSSGVPAAVAALRQAVASLQ